MNKLLIFVEKHILKIITVPFVIDFLQIAMTFLQSIDDQLEGIFDCDQMTSMVKDGNYLCMFAIAIVMVVLKHNKNK